MKYLIVPLVLLLIGCTSPDPMSTGEAASFKDCLDRNMIPHFYANGAQRTVSCKRQQR